MYSLPKVLYDVYSTCKQNPRKQNGSDLLKVTQRAISRDKHNFLTPCNINPGLLFRNISCNKFTFPNCWHSFFLFILAHSLSYHFSLHAIVTVAYFGRTEILMDMVEISDQNWRTMLVFLLITVKSRFFGNESYQCLWAVKLKI